ncbi:secretoglobin family 1D member 1-like [Camelus dromedarius]|uniref:secretoglobin family 1D member 1-like n=1 Tax=Camelus dromedarius TaxID=9838 RepID=UPI00057B9CD6|nr:secretoglobin family 1D member 1-like [Camelus dromedarius]
MRLSLTVLLVTLALCCYEASAIVCPHLASDNAGFLWEPDEAYRKQIEMYQAPAEAVEAKLQVKQCVNDFSKEKRLLLTKALTKVLVKCGYEDLERLLPLNIL